MSISSDFNNIKSKAREALNQAWEGLGDYVVGVDQPLQQQQHASNGDAQDVAQTDVQDTKTTYRGKTLEAKFKNFLKANQCVFQRSVDKDEDRERVKYLFDYQGGHFVAYFYNDTAFELLYAHFQEAEIEHINLVRTLCNHYNTVCIYQKVYYSTDEKNNKVHIHLSMLCDTVDEKLSARLLSFFNVQRDFCNELDKCIKASKEAEVTDLEKANAMLDREMYLVRELQLAHQPLKTHRSSAAFSFSLQELLRLLLNDDSAELERATVVTHEGIATSVDNPQNMAAHEPLIAVDNGSASFTTSEAAVVAWVKSEAEGDGQARMVTLMLSQQGEARGTLYYTAAISKPAEAAARNRTIGNNDTLSNNVSVLLAFDVKPDKLKEQEAEYMWQDALLKLKNKERLTEEERLLCHITHPDIALHVYWARQLIRHELYAQALKHLLNAFDAYHTNLYLLSEEERADFVDVYYYAALCCLRLGMLDKSFFFVDQLRGSDDVRHIEMFVVILSQARDMRVFHIIDRFVKNIMDSAAESGDNSMLEQVEGFINFLRLKRAGAAIDFYQFDDAEKVLKDLLEDPTLHDAAIGELARLKNVKSMIEAKEQEKKSMLDNARKRREEAANVSGENGGSDGLKTETAND